jgi:hypothetical protein
MAEIPRSDIIIQPAPAQSAVCSSQDTSPRNNIVVTTQTVDSKLNNLMSQLRLINNICDPIRELTQFRNSMSTDIRMIVELNGLVCIIYGIKATVKLMIDENYSTINDHPQTLKNAMEKTYATIDSVCESMVTSIKEIIMMGQTRLSHPTSSKQEDVLISMTQSKLP